MKKNREITITGVIVESTRLSVTEIARLHTISEETIFELAELGLFHTNTILHKDSQLDDDAIQRLEAALHIWLDLNINLPGVVLALELRDELEKARKELEFLHKYLSEK